MSAFRTAAGGQIDRSRSLRFSFDGQSYTGHPGDTLASALLANGVHLLGRSFKYHRPRGVLSAGSDEPNALVTVWRDSARYTPNLLATQVEIYDGLQARSQNRWPSLGFDIGALWHQLVTTSSSVAAAARLRISCCSRRTIRKTKCSNSGRRSCGPGLASGWPWKPNAG